MSIEFREDPTGKVINVTASGKLTREDYERFVPETERRIREHGKIRILFEMNDFHGWEAGALWDDVVFDLKHFNDIERLAMVGDKTWEHGMALFCRPFITAKLRYFEHGQLAEAAEWLQEGISSDADHPHAVQRA